MAYTSDDLARLQSALAKGTRRLRIGSEEVEFRTLDEMLRLEAKIRRELGQKSAGRIVQPSTTSGWR